jgi:type 2 lantibiotic biosynthesis protein LanM
MKDAPYLDVAHGLGMRLCRDALWSGAGCNWSGDSLEFVDSTWKVVHKVCGPDLYSGNGGIALFLARLFFCTQEQIFKKTAAGAIHCALSQIQLFDSVADFGFYCGLTGMAYALTEVGVFLNEDEFVQLGLKLLDELCSREPVTTQGWDVLSGSAGVVPVLLKLHARYALSFLLDSAVRHGDFLLQAAHPSEEGWSWRTYPDPAVKNLTGFSHGTAGIAWSLVELHKKSGEVRFLKAAQEALRYERTWFNPEQENWPDFRSDSYPGASRYVVGWCHGAAGIGLSRTRLFQLLQDKECLAEAQAAIRSTTRVLNHALAKGEANYSLCHGNFGNAELLILAGNVLSAHESMQTVHRLAADAIEKYHSRSIPWTCGVRNGGETPNLMLGLAGIGYFFLRLYAPEKTPSVLLVGPE